jgi:hypothetical protein
VTIPPRLDPTPLLPLVSNPTILSRILADARFRGSFRCCVTEQANSNLADLFASFVRGSVWIRFPSSARIARPTEVRTRAPFIPPKKGVHPTPISRDSRPLWASHTWGRFRRLVVWGYV